MMCLQVCLATLGQPSFCNATLEDIQKAAEAESVPHFLPKRPASGHALLEEVAKLGQLHQSASPGAPLQGDQTVAINTMLTTLHMHQVTVLMSSAELCFGRQ